MRFYTPLSAALLTVFSLSASATQAPASEAEIAFNQEVLQCAAYYHIASDAISNMDAPQMKPVGERLKQSGEAALTLAKQYQSEAQVEQLLQQAIAKQQASLPNNKSLGGLMGRYKTPCQNLLANPQQRLDYWIMATM
ncbi:hypothetical protein [Shewanella algidipiscicola]|uniref:Secreted protein n=1 Tax=Shewanella algidipiscicola TaxID=614070 RepID=A0ABQ4P5G5_9GAMM|nr:hypothetical protein [Shewanella algidipiscicola]GIU42758.1 hypothetical protein TUM4630_04450 [Shewanella algidipiscicola]